MQDKVNFAPPKPIEMFGGKPPPTSWVNDNIVRYLQTQSNIGILTDVLAYLTTLQREQILKARLPTPNLPFTPASIPEEGSPKQVANTASFNALQPLLKEQIEILTLLIGILKEGKAGQGKELQSMLTQLNQMAKGFPNLSEEQLSQLGPMMARLTELVKSAPYESQKNFWDQKMLMLQRMLQSLEESIKNDQKQIEELTLLLQMLKNLKGSHQNLQRLVGQLTTKPPSSSEVSQMLAALQSLADAFPELSNSPKRALSKYLQHLSKIGTKKGSLPALLSAALVKEWVVKFLKSNPGATPLQLQSYLRQIFLSSNLNKSDIPFIKEMGHAIEDALEKEKLPFGAAGAKEPLVEEIEGKVVPNEGAISSLSSAVKVDKESITDTEDLHATAQKAYEETGSKNRNVMEGLKLSTGTLDRTKHSIGRSAVWGATQHHEGGKGIGATRGGGGEGDSLPNQFRNAILNHYMPQQEAYLFALADLLSFDNMGASFGNILMNQMLDFGSASANYSFGSSLSGGKGNVFSGSATAEQAKLTKEKSKCIADIKAIMKAQLAILAKITSVENNPNYSPQQKAAMISKLKNIQNNLSQAYNQVHDLLTTLLTIVISQGADDNHYVVTTSNNNSNWQQDLNTGEDDVINGDPTQEYPGGLGPTLDLVTNFQQDYSNLSTQVQMKLQMTMTETQQEWTIVSTALSLLNQAYMAFAQGIYH